MCGIIGYIGDKKAQAILLNGLANWNTAVTIPAVLPLIITGLRFTKMPSGWPSWPEKLAPHDGRTGIGHTRWATHGEPSMKNAHPHCDCTGKIAVVHNGTINNFLKLRKQLVDEGHVLASDTDTEILPHLIEKYFKGDLVTAVEKALQDVEGSYTMIALMSGVDKLVAARKDSPLIIGIGDRENFIASDVPALLDYTSRVIYLEDGDIAVVGPKKVVIRRDGAEVKREEHRITWSVEDAQQGRLRALYAQGNPRTAQGHPGHPGGIFNSVGTSRRVG